MWSTKSITRVIKLKKLKIYNLLTVFREMNMQIMDLNLDKAKEIGKRILLTNVRTEIEIVNPLNNIKWDFSTAKKKG